MSDNIIPRERLRAGVVECPLCGRQIAEPTEQLRLFGPGEPTVETADAVECPVCDGVSFLTSRADGSE
ncbi:MAG: hypothetical protein ABEI39_02960 [Halobacteriales archaeon]